MENNAQLDRIEAMLQVTLEAICSLAKETTGKSMVIGHFPDDPATHFGATPLSDSIKWVESDQPAVPVESCPKPPAFGS